MSMLPIEANVGAALSRDCVGDCAIAAKGRSYRLRYA